MRQQPETGPWRDGKRYLWLFGLVMPLLPFLAVGLHALTGWGVWLWLGPLVILGLVPIVDALAGRDGGNPPAELLAALEQDRYYRWLTFLFLPLQYAGFAFAFWYLATADLTVANKVGLAVTVGFIGGLGINAAHELGHKKEQNERWLAKIALAQTMYGHFYTEHNRGHHVRVATPEDPASARLGESFYRFWPRTVAGSAVNAWRVEGRRYARHGTHPFHWGNDVLHSLALSVALWAVMTVWLGPGILPYLVIQALVGITLLEAVNYLEHYGLLRQIVGVPGKERYERVEPRHSWNSNNITTNVLLYHLQRHSDHHARPTKRYQALLNDDDAPTLPTGYAGMILLALVPPLWRRVMDPRVLAHYGGDITRANRGHRPAIVASPAAAPAADVPADSASIVACCPQCGFVFDERLGCPREGFGPGTAWARIPDAWVCPDCGVRDKADFVISTA